MSAVARLQQKGGVSHKNLVQMLHCCWEGEMMILLPFYELGSLHSLLEEDRWIKDTEHLTWAKNGALLKLAIGIANGMEFLHEFSSPFPEGSTCAEPGCTNAASFGAAGEKTADRCSAHTPSDYVNHRTTPIYHRDLKGDNVLIEGSESVPPAEWNVRISDFGESKEAYFHQTMTQAGTPVFMAPEGARLARTA